jgi:S-DNA-T family DNA segregation ATPase FtsK/SpoIIIE
MPILILWACLAVVALIALYLFKITQSQPVPDAYPAWDVDLAFALSVLTTPEWAAILWTSTGLGTAEDLPVILNMDPTPAGAAIELLMPMGGSVTTWQKQAETLAASLGVPQVKVTDALRGCLVLSLIVNDTLAEPTPVPRAEYSDLDAIPCGITDTGEIWTMPVLGRHILYSGVSGSGKSSAVWALIAGLGPAIRSGLVELWGIDPKQVELEPGRDLFSRLVMSADETAVDLLTELVEVMDTRLEIMAASGVRRHIPNMGEPLIVAWLDEVLMLTAFGPDVTVRKESDKLIRRLLSQGRAAAIVLIPCTQDPSKEVMGWRQMVTTRIGLRMDESGQTAMVLGASARDNGAHCDTISQTTPGVAYVGEDGTPGFNRVRAYHVSDADIADLVKWYAPTCRHPGCDVRTWDNAHLVRHQGPSHQPIRLRSAR